MYYLLFNFIKFLLVCLVSAAGIFMFVVFLISVFCKQSIEKSVHILLNFISSVLNGLSSLDTQTISPVLYPVFIGWNSISLRSDIVNSYFEKLGTYWDTYFFDQILNNDPNVVIYVFRIYDLKPTYTSRLRLLMSVRHIAEEALTRHFHNINFYNAPPIDHFIAVNMRNDLLYIAFAKTDAGFEVIEKLRSASH